MCIRDRYRDVNSAATWDVYKRQEHTTAELGLLQGDLGELYGDHNGHKVRLSKVENSVSIIEEAMSTKISAVEESDAF